LQAFATPLDIVDADDGVSYGQEPYWAEAPDMVLNPWNLLSKPDGLHAQAFRHGEGVGLQRLQAWLDAYLRRPDGVFKDGVLELVERIDAKE
jgi:hypothetical protein